MSVYKLELEKASIIIKKETIINPPPVIETVDIPDGVTFGYSDFSDIENLKKVLPYVNNGNYGQYLFGNAKFSTNYEIEIRPANGDRTFSGASYIPKKVIIDCSRAKRLEFTFTANGIWSIVFKNTENIEYIHSIFGSSLSYYNSICGLDVGNCSYLYLGNPGYIKYYEIFNLGKHPDLTEVKFNTMAYDSYGEGRQCTIKNVMDYSFDRAEAGYAPCTIMLFWRLVNELTEEQIAKITSKGYTITT